jgi:hypothetical protein
MVKEFYTLRGTNGICSIGSRFPCLPRGAGLPFITNATAASRIRPIAIDVKGQMSTWRRGGFVLGGQDHIGVFAMEAALGFDRGGD